LPPVRMPLRRRSVYWWEDPPRWRDRLPRRRRAPETDAAWYRHDDWAEPEPVIELEPDREPARAATVTATQGHMPYLPAFDGLRAIALLAVLAFHAGFGWIHGGYLPLTAFFVLSGFLITSLLLLERGRSGRVDLGAFWMRRARRLVPAAILALGLVALYTAAIGRSVEGLRGDVFACLGWVANWRFIFVGRTYEDLFGDPSPVQHFWSLAVEEQFYLVVPPLAVGLLLLAKGRRWLFALVTTLLVAASTITMAVLHDPGEPPLRVYFGTDTRAAELLVGVLLALIITRPNGLRQLAGAGRWVLDIAGALALGASVALWFVTQEYDDRLYEGGLLGIALLAAIVVASGTQPGSPVSRMLGIWPLPALGRISYGVYLFHWPLFLWIDEERTGLEQGPLFALRMAVTIGLAALSYVLVEQPIRTGTRSPARLLLTGWANASVAVAALLVVVSTTTAPEKVTTQTADGPTPQVIRAERPSSTTAAPTSTDPSTTLADGTTSTASSRSTASTRTRATTASTPGSSTTGTSGSSTTPTTGRGTGGAPTTGAPTTAPTTTVPRPLRVMVVGDSISVNLGAGLGRHAQKHGDMEILNFGANGCAISGEDGMRYPNGAAHFGANGCDARRAQWPGQLSSFDPDVVLVQSSIFDILDRTRVEWGVGTYYHVGDGPFDSWLVGHHRAAINSLRSNGAKVVWTTVPCAEFHPEQHANHHDNTEGNRRINLVNGLMRQLGVTVADFRDHVCPGGAFSSTVDGVGGARPDGVHFTDAAAEAIADRWLAPLLLSMR
ncbi:MAG TPA: acyltransferase family protein, partial [Acidimicrobiales bacterium]|nr:acyltransferase family protein [Acidimicrobiales bacterium]